MPHRPEPYWRESGKLPSFPALSADIEVDAAVVGGGITGITAAYLLAKEGLSVALLEADLLVNGTTGHTTAKITAQHDVIYDELIHHFGEEKARAYYDANDEALQLMKNLISEHSIDCDFSEQDAYIYVTEEKNAEKIEKEARAYETLGIPGGYVDQLPIGLKIHSGVVMKNQAQFNPVKYLIPLVKELQAMGVQIYEHTRVNDAEKGSPAKVKTLDGHTVTCRHAVSCSHFPFMDGKGMYFARLHPERSYVVAGKISKPYAGGMYLSADSPSRSIRYTPMNGEELILIGGEGHKTGQSKDTMKHYEALRTFGQTDLDLKETLYRWSAQDLFSVDTLPYIGHLTEDYPNVFVATGFRKWGMAFGTAAAVMARDYVIGKENKYADLFTPSRFKADPGLKTLVAENTNVAGHLIGGKLSPADKKMEELHPDEGALVHYNGQKAAVYKDENGQITAVDATCTHMGCEVAWNSGDRTWDCPCHGSRFSVDGEVVEGPADTPLKKLN
nr:FAD-dependent oxidoreductase [Metabacillus kandeliae]